MAGKNKFIIKRSDLTVDDVTLETDGLTIGRLITNDLALNHRTVSRTHAGIIEINGEYWVFNLSTSNGTVLNGALVDKTALADGDVLQIGRYILRVSYAGDALAITVEMEQDAQLGDRPGAPPPSQLPTAEEANQGTQMFQRVAAPRVSLPTSQLKGTGLMTGVFAPQAELALMVFWEKRKREAGKIAEKSGLRPKGDRRVGKAQFNWRPTQDLRKLWRKSYFVWGGLIVAVTSGITLLIYSNAYSPGGISSVHTTSQLSERSIALRANGGSCVECHSPAASIQVKCASCHQTQLFEPSVSKTHTDAGLMCASCHGEHMGVSFRPGLVGSAMCVSCHNNSYKFKGRALGSPHGGAVGYPVVNRRWEWTGLSEADWKRKALADTASKYAPREQFHILHVSGREEGRTNCTDCHSAGLHTDEGLHQSPRAACAACHSVSFDPGGTIVGPNCTSCHVQHGADKNLVAAVRVPTRDGDLPVAQSSAAGSPPAGKGGAQVIRHDDTGARWSMQSDVQVGGLPLYFWGAALLLVPLLGLAAMAASTIRRGRFMGAAKAGSTIETEVEKAGARFIDIAKIKAEGPAYPHPVIDSVLCIGCHACVEACPHDVLAIVNGVSTPIALDQCMEDTGCTVECPTSPKACIIINGTKKIPPRKVPNRNQRLMTNVPGVYMVGDVSGVPLIKNALNEGAQVIDYVIEDLRNQGPAKSEYDVAIIGVGPAGLSATALAKQRGLRYVAVEQDKIVSTIQNYPAGKYVFFKPDTVEPKGGVPLEGAGNQKEVILGWWMKSMMQHGIEISEDESCKDIKKEDGIFRIVTEKGKLKEKATYTASAVILAIGNRGTPMKLRVPGEEITMVVKPGPIVAKHCPKCGQARIGKQLFCVSCGQKLPVRTPGPMEDTKVKYKLSDPDDYVGKKCIIVGAGNSSIESAVALTGFNRVGEKITFTRNNEVALVVRSDFKGDLKLGNKMDVYDCMDAGKITVFFRTEIKEITENEVVLIDVRTKEEKARLANDYVFALIGGEKPTKFLEGIGVKIG
ncbi:MAG: NAD(P)-binding domain-containing protein [Acidobacteriota bacterium]